MDNDTEKLTDIIKDELKGEHTHRCEICGDTFRTAAGVRVHKARKHGKGWSTTANLRGRKGEKQRLERRREYQKRLRDRYYSEGRNSKGERMPAGWKPRKWKNRRVKWTATDHDTPPEAAPAPRSNLETAAAAIISAAQVLRAVAVGMKIGH